MINIGLDSRELLISIPCLSIKVILFWQYVFLSQQISVCFGLTGMAEILLIRIDIEENLCLSASKLLNPEEIYACTDPHRLGSICIRNSISMFQTNNLEVHVEFSLDFLQTLLFPIFPSCSRDAQTKADQKCVNFKNRSVFRKRSIF